ncbi:MAG: excinuclease ABC subunit UvrA [Pirellulales bacterium]|nr:excinuclease ABC subunit UvrA [Pirellulales bacterium]
MAASDIVIKGAREHNLRDVSLALPRNRLICLTGVSGSGKSSLAFDTLYAEGQRRYVESLSTFARQFLGQLPKPDVDLIQGLSPSISISQKTSGQNPRSTVGTITEIYDFLRVLYARCGQGHCPRCSRPITAQTREQIIEQILARPSEQRFLVLAPIVRQQKGEFRDLFDDLIKQGFVRARVDGTVISLSEEQRLDRQMRHDIEVVVDRLVTGPQIRPRLAEAVDLALRLGEGNLIVAPEQASAPAPPVEDGGDESPSAPRRGARQRQRPGDVHLSAHYACTPCGLSFEPLSPQLFSFNSPQGMCPDCDGLGERYTFDPALLVPNPGRSFKQGCFELIGPWKEMGRWRKHIYNGIAEALERDYQLDPGTVLETAWEEVPAEIQRQLLWGTGERHITYTWGGGSGAYKYGGRWEGILPDLLGKYRNSKSAMQRRQLEKYMKVLGCSSCRGQRLNPQARSVRIATREAGFAAQPALTLPEVCELSVADAVRFFSALELDDIRGQIAAEVLKEIRARLTFLLNVGLEYLTLARTAPTLSGGESQRIRLAGQIGSGLVGVLYILDEPSIGLHPRDNDRLLASLVRLRDMGNTVIVVEHDEDTMRAADHLVDFGPGPGVRGGEIVATGKLTAVAHEPRSLTGQFLSGQRKIEVPRKRRPAGDKRLVIRGAQHNNLKNVDADIPLGTFVCVTGVSGSGKSSLVNDILVEALRRDLNGGEGTPGAFRELLGLEHLDKLIAIDQSPIGRTPRSNPATYIKVFDDIRKLYTQLPDSKARGYKDGRFSFNVEGGRCEACEGNGSNRLEMDFLADVWVTCPVCQGHRFNRETLQIRFKDKSISDVLEMDIQQALSHFENITPVRHKLQTLHDVGLDYLKLGQPSPTLSGGEAQRIKLARELVKKSTGKTLYLLDEPTTGLHFADIELLLKVLHNFVEAGNTVLVVEHNLDVIKTADWVIDLGPEGGAGGGEIIATGTPEQVSEVTASHTGRALAPLLGRKAAGAAKPATPKASAKATPPPEPTKAIVVQGARQHNLKGVDVEIPRDAMTVCCGLSGSGKSSLAMDTIYAEGQRRYVESLSAYARQFVGQMQKPQLDHISGLSPAIAIEQKNLGHTPRSTVGTVTEIYDYLRVMFARLGTLYCPTCDVPIGTQTVDEIVDKVLAEPEGSKLYLMAPLFIEVGERYEVLWDDLRKRGYQRVRIDGETHSLDAVPTIDRRRKHEVAVVVDRIALNRSARSRLADSIESALSLGQGVLHVAHVETGVPEPRWRVQVHSQHYACDRCGRSFEPLAPHNFSFNSALGWCPACEGLGTQTGANPAALLRDPKLTLAAGAVSLWPHVEVAMFRAMLDALATHARLPVDVPFEQLDARSRRIVMHGCGDDWIAITRPGTKATDDAARPWFRFQYKGLYPALDEAARLSPSLRGRLDQFVDEVECSTCAGSRLRDDAAAVRFQDYTLDGLCRLPLDVLSKKIEAWRLSGSQQKVAGELLREIRGRLEFLVDVGLDYLTLSRPAATLSGGEAQRIRLASQVGSGLTGVLYVLDEPTIGLHPRDNRRLIRALTRLRDLGNTLLLVEHDREVIATADRLLDFGPGAGRLGGQIVASGTPQDVSRSRSSVTGPYLSGKKSIAVPSNRRMRPLAETVAEPPTNGAKQAAKRTKGKSPAGPAPFVPPGSGWLEVLGARHHNLRGADLRIPLGAFTAITGVSGSGKSSLVDDVMYSSLAKVLHRARITPGAHDAIRGVERINKVIRVDQQALGNTPTSNPATYTGTFDLIRQLFAQVPEAKLRGFTPRRFSFNVPGGRCEVCEGNGQKRIEMHFLPDVWVECDTCRGKRYNPETLAVRYKGQSIADVLEMSCREALDLLGNIPAIRRILQTLCDVGLDYLTLGQPAPTLSGGEAQRVKLAAELARPDTGQTLYVLDEPTTGLHFDDLVKLLDVLNRLVDLGNTVVVIEHNLDVIKTADWLIDLGPEAGDGGGWIVAQGTPEDVVAQARNHAGTAAGRATGKPSRAKQKSLAGVTQQRSYTGEMLAEVLEAGPHAERPKYDPHAEQSPRVDDLELAEVGQDAKMPWQIDGRRWHTQERVGRNGVPCRWDGKILAAIIDKIQESGAFSETNYDNRTIVEISAERKADGWFFHASTGHEWLLTLKFRTAKRTFQRDKLVEALDLKPLNELPELPIYGNEPRVKCKQLRGPWQEVQLQVHSWEEIDKPAFWEFLAAAIAGFEKFTERKSQRPEDIMPWKVLGQKWHFARRGFPPGKTVRWKTETLEELCEMLAEVAPQGQFLWNQQQVVHLLVPQQPDPWATIHTKRVAGIDLELRGPRNLVALGRIADLGAEREVQPDRSGKDLVKLRLIEPDDLQRGNLRAFLQEHLASLKNGKALA